MKVQFSLLHLSANLSRLEYLSENNARTYNSRALLTLGRFWLFNYHVKRKIRRRASTPMGRAVVVWIIHLKTWKISINCVFGSTMKRTVGSTFMFSHHVNSIGRWSFFWILNFRYFPRFNFFQSHISLLLIIHFRVIFYLIAEVIRLSFATLFNLLIIFNRLFFSLINHTLVSHQKLSTHLHRILIRRSC